jgi:hypothetical protein
MPRTKENKRGRSSSPETGNNRPRKRERNADGKKGGPSTRQAARSAEGENPVPSPIPLLQASQPTPGSLGEPLAAFPRAIPLTAETLAQEPLGIILELGMCMLPSYVYPRN